MQVVTVIFLIDTSGSMYGNKIAALNASMVECWETLRAYSRKHKGLLKIGYATFDEKMSTIMFVPNMEEAEAPQFSVDKRSDGYYALTSFRCIYEGIENYIKNRKDKDATHCFYLVTDGKPVDSLKYTEIMEQVKSTDVFRHAKRIAAVVEKDSNSVDKDLLEFVGYKADKVIELNHLSNEVEQMLTWEFEDASDTNDSNAKYDSIFG